MIIENIDNKRYIRMNKIFISSIIFLLFLFSILIYTVHFFVAHHDTIYSDPLVWGAKEYKVNLCSCTTLRGDLFYFNQTSVWYRVEPTPFQSVNWSLIIKDLPS